MVFEEIEISGAQNKRKGVLRCYNNHFTFAISDHITCKWTYFDDLSVNLQEFSNFRSLQQVYREGWFFKIYEQREMPIQCEESDCTGHLFRFCSKAQKKVAEALKVE